LIRGSPVLALRSDLVADRSTALHAGALTRHGRSARLAPSSGRRDTPDRRLAMSLPTAGRLPGSPGNAAI